MKSKKRGNVGWSEKAGSSRQGGEGKRRAQSLPQEQHFDLQNSTSTPLKEEIKSIPQISLSELENAEMPAGNSARASISLQSYQILVRVNRVGARSFLLEPEL